MLSLTSEPALVLVTSRGRAELRHQMSLWVQVASELLHMPAQFAPVELWGSQAVHQNDGEFQLW